MDIWFILWYFGIFFTILVYQEKSGNPAAERSPKLSTMPAMTTDSKLNFVWVLSGLEGCAF
jgi:hypothetical protein